MQADRRDYGRQSSVPPSASSGSTEYPAVRAKSAGGAMTKATRELITKTIAALAQQRR
jgi:hypothetical protein